MALAQRINRVFPRRQHQQYSFVQDGTDRGRRLSAGFGIVRRRPNDDLTGIIGRADQEQHRAKRAGPNVVCWR